jgi:hypothetical protein
MLVEPALHGGLRRSYVIFAVWTIFAGAGIPLIGFE